MSPAAEAGVTGAVTDDQSGSANSSGLVPVLPVAIGLTILLLLSCLIFIFAYRRSRLRKAMIERKTQQEREWMRANPIEYGQYINLRERKWQTPARNETVGEAAEQDSFLTVLPNAPTADRGSSKTRFFSPSPSPPPPAYTTIAKNGELR